MSQTCGVTVEPPAPATLCPSNSWTLTGEYAGKQRVYSVTEMCRTDFYVVLRGLKCAWATSSDLFKATFGTGECPPRLTKLRTLHRAVVCLSETDSYSSENVNLVARFVAEWYRTLHADMCTSEAGCDQKELSIDLFRFKHDGTKVMQVVADLQRQLDDYTGDAAQSTQLLQKIKQLNVHQHSGAFRCQVVVCDEVRISALDHPTPGYSRCAEEETWFLSLEPLGSSRTEKTKRIMSVEQTMDLALYLVTNRTSSRMAKYCVHLDALSYLILEDKITTDGVREDDTLKKRYTLAVAIMALIFHEQLLPIYNNPECPPPKSELEVADPHLRMLQQHVHGR